MCALQLCNAKARCATRTMKPQRRSSASMAFSQRFGVEAEASAGVAAMVVNPHHARAGRFDGAAPRARRPRRRAEALAEHGSARGAGAGAPTRSRPRCAASARCSPGAPSLTRRVAHATNDAERAASDAFFGWLVTASDLALRRAGGASAGDAARRWPRRRPRPLAGSRPSRSRAPAPWAIACADAVPMHSRATTA